MTFVRGKAGNPEGRNGRKSDNGSLELLCGDIDLTSLESVDSEEFACIGYQATCIEQGLAENEAKTASPLESNRIKW